MAFLGIILVDKQDFKGLTNVVCEKPARVGGMLPSHVLLMFLHSHMIYGITSFGKSSAGNVNRVTILRTEKYLSSPALMANLFRKFSDLFTSDKANQFFLY